MSDTKTLSLSGAECYYLVLELSADVVWTPDPRLPQTEPAGGPAFRLRFLAPAAGPGAAEHSFNFTEPELWLLDTFLMPHLRTGKLPDGRSVEQLARKVWTGLLAFHGPMYGAVVKEASNARDENDHQDELTHAHIAGGATADGPGDGAGAGEMVPAAD